MGCARRTRGDTVLHNLEENVATLGWGNWLTDADAAEFADRDALDRIFDQRFGEEHSESVRRRARQEILRFRDRFGPAILSFCR